MRKAIFTVLVVLLALLAVTCDNGILPVRAESGPGQTVPDEPGTVTLGISIGSPTGRARALTGQTAQTDEADFYEVVFMAPNTGNVYRQTWNGTVNGNGGSTFNMTVAEGDYDNTGGAKGTAVIFAGKYVSSTEIILLGVGVVDETSTDGGTTFTSGHNIVGGAVGTATTNVKFLITPLVTGVSTTANLSKFTITGGTGVTATPNTATSLPELETNPGGPSAKVPVFELPAVAVTGVTAAWQFSGSDTEYVVVTNVTPGTLVTAAAYINPHQTSETGQAVSVTGITQNDSPTHTAITIDETTLDDIITSGGFRIVFTTTAVSPGAFGTLALSVPVKLAIPDMGTLRPNGTSAGTAGTVASVGGWHLRGGLDNTALDNGTGTGGRVLLRIGNPTVSDDTVDIGVTSGWTP